MTFMMYMSVSIHVKPGDNEALLLPGKSESTPKADG